MHDHHPASHRLQSSVPPVLAIDVGHWRTTPGNRPPPEPDAATPRPRAESEAARDAPARHAGVE
jgi:hypothetical protein